MAWVKLDDDFFGNPKVLRAGRDARDLYLAGLCFCNRGLTDGFIPDEALRRLGADADVDDPLGSAARLVDVGLWARVDGGHMVHQFLDYQPSAEKVKAEREAAAERMRKLRSSEVRANTTRSAKEVRPTPSRTRPVPVQDPEPDPAESTDDAPAAPERVKYSALFETFWREWNSGITKGRGDKKPAYDEWKRLGLDRPAAELLRAEVIEGLLLWKASAKWHEEGGRYVRHAERWLKARGWETDPPDDGPPRASSERPPPGLGFSAAAQRLERMRRGAGT